MDRNDFHKMSTKSTGITAGLIIAAVILSGVLGFYFATITVASHASAQQSVNTTTQQQQKNSTVVVDLDIVPDFGGAGYDAFVLAGDLNNTLPSPASNTTAQGQNDNNITLAANTQVKFVITSIDSAVLQNFSGSVSTPFAIYNSTDSGEASVQFGTGQTVSNLPIGHTFTVTELGLNIPLAPSTVTTFTYTFTKPGVYQYVCLTPCGPGMGLMGYMSGYLIVK